MSILDVTICYQAISFDWHTVTIHFQVIYLQVMHQMRPVKSILYRVWFFWRTNSTIFFRLTIFVYNFAVILYTDNKLALNITLSSECSTKTDAILQTKLMCRYRHV